MPQKSLADAMDAKPGPESLAYWLAPLEGYWKRQGALAQGGLDMADQGAKSVQGGDMGGLAGMLLGPAGYLASPITALLPTSDETYAAGDLPEWAKPGVAGGLAGMMAVMPGPKMKGLGKGMSQLADDATDAERAALAARLEGEAAQSGGQAVTTPRDQALRNLTEAPKRLFHSTTADFDTFNTDAHRGFGAHFGTSDAANDRLRDIAASDVLKDGSRVIPANVDIRNPLRLPDLVTWNADDMKSALRMVTSENGTRVFPDEEIAAAARQGLWDGKEAAARLKKLIESKGYDGVVYQNAVEGTRGAQRDSYIAFHPHQIAQEAPGGITAYHGSPHKFDKFDMSKIGTGEGAQAYGHGLYFAEAEAVGKQYRDTLSALNVTHATDGAPISPSLQNMLTDARAELTGSTHGVTRGGMVDIVGEKLKRQMDDAAKAGDFEWYGKAADLNAELHRNAKNVPVGGGSMYQVRINAKPEEFLDWDRPLSEQAGPVGDRLKTILKDRNRTPDDWIKSSPGAEQRMREAGIKGIRYKDAGSRAGEGGTYNYVVFDDSIIDILKRYGIPMTAGAGGAMVVSGQNMPPELAEQMPEG